MNIPGFGAVGRTKGRKEALDKRPETVVQVAIEEAAGSHNNGTAKAAGANSSEGSRAER